LCSFFHSHIADLASRHAEKDVHRTDRHIPLFAGEDIPHPDPSSPFYNEHGPGTNVHMEQLKDILLTYVEWDTPPPETQIQSSSSSPSPSNLSNPSAENLGYVQGMSDLLAPLYAVFQDDALTFWCFAGFMKRTSQNFSRSQTGMRRQLSTLDQLVQFLDPELYLHLQSADSTNFFFFFRMLLVWYKREFEWSDVLRLWEALWTDYLSAQYHIFIAMAILEKHRDVLMEHLKHFDEVLKYFNELSGTIDLMDTLVRSEKLFKKFESMVNVVEKGKASLPPRDPQKAEILRRNRMVVMGGPAMIMAGAKMPPVTPQAQARASGSDAGPKDEDGKKTEVISSELRGLLSKEREK
jgi:TBC1 domain family member 15